LIFFSMTEIRSLRVPMHFHVRVDAFHVCVYASSCASN
jgi:hypothetical protein